MKKTVIIFLSVMFLLLTIGAFINWHNINKQIQFFANNSEFVKIENNISYYEVDENNQIQDNINLYKPGNIIYIPIPQYNNQLFQLFISFYIGAHIAFVSEGNQIIEAPGFTEKKVIKRANYYVNDQSRLQLIIEPQVSDEELVRIIQEAENLTGYKYDYLFWKNNNRYSCSELIWFIFNNAEINLKNAGVVVTPNELLKNDLFKVQAVIINNDGNKKIYYRD